MTFNRKFVSTSDGEMRSLAAVSIRLRRSATDSVGDAEAIGAASSMPEISMWGHYIPERWNCQVDKSGGMAVGFFLFFWFFHSQPADIRVLVNSDWVLRRRGGGRTWYCRGDPRAWTQDSELAVKAVD